MAFSAGLTHNMNISHAETVVYDKVFTNIGGGYNNNTGIFNVPTAGIYAFQVRCSDIHISTKGNIGIRYICLVTKDEVIT